MKKWLTLFSFVIAMIFLNTASFAAMQEPIKSSALQQLPAGASTADCAFYPTCITVTNEASYPIDIYVPALSFFRTLYPHYLQPIVSYDYDYKRLVLYDDMGYAFFDAYVPNHYDVIVRNIAGKLSAVQKA